MWWAAATRYGIYPTAEAGLPANVRRAVTTSNGTFPKGGRITSKFLPGGRSPKRYLFHGPETSPSVATREGLKAEPLPRAEVGLPANFWRAAATRYGIYPTGGSWITGKCQEGSRFPKRKFFHGRGRSTIKFLAGSRSPKRNLPHGPVIVPPPPRCERLKKRKNLKKGVAFCGKVWYYN